MSTSVSERPPATVAEQHTSEETSPEASAKAKRAVKIGMFIGLFGALCGSIGGYTAPGAARAKLDSWHKVTAVVTDVDTRGTAKRRKTYVSLAYLVDGKTIETEINEGRSSDRKPGERIAILVSPKDLKQTEWASNVESMAHNSPIAGLFRGAAVGFISFLFVAGILALLWLRVKEKFSPNRA